MPAASVLAPTPAPTLLTLKPAVNAAVKSVLPAHLADPQTHSIWNAVAKSADAVQVNGATIRSPVVLQAPAEARSLPSDAQTIDADSLPPAQGFVLGGDLDVFGVQALKGAIRSWHGPPPASAGQTSAPPVYQHVTLDKSCAISDIFPAVADTIFKEFELANVTFTYQSAVL